MKMPLLFVLAAAGILLGCSGSGRKDGPGDRISDLEDRVQIKMDKEHATAQMLTEKVIKLENRISALESERDLLKVDIRRLQEKVAILQATGPAAAQPPPSGPGGPTLAETSAKIDAALERLKNGGSVEEATKELVPLSRYSAPRMAEALGQHLTDVRFTKALEEILAKCPPEDLKNPLADAAKDRVRRAAAARIVGAVGNAELSGILEPYIGEASPVNQVEIGKALLACRNRMGVPPLLKALRAPNSDTRFVALLELRPLAKQTFGYDFNKGPEENAEALQAWDAWWEKEGAKLFE
ncbi:MAG: hypothetical protein HY716_10905 [Planctomycetes bacterium]|nr:hypothetical protein [Planctomycetota bacterium]